MLKVVVIGSGNVAQHLISAFEKSGQVHLLQAFARNPAALAHLLPQEKITGTFSDMPEADLYIISVSDDAIAEVSAQLPFEGRLVVHTSGSAPLERLDAKNRRGVFYPLQTFSKTREVDFSAVPFCLESEHAADYEKLEALANVLSKNTYSISSQQRRSLHVAAVFVSNFTNHLYTIGNSICLEHNIPFSILKPLIQETAGKIQQLDPAQAQTGPAIRHDEKTIAAHLAFLQDENQKEIYNILTRSIQNTHV